jgi:hypothetical protein
MVRARARARGGFTFSSVFDVAVLSTSILPGGQFRADQRSPLRSCTVMHLRGPGHRWSAT